MWWLLMVCLSLQSSSSLASPLTVCEVLQDLKASQGKSIAVLGRWSGSPEGEGESLSEVDCARPVKTKGFTWPNALSLEWDPHSPLELDVSAMNQEAVAAKLQAVKRTTKLRAGERWAVVYGRLETRKLKVTQSRDRKTVSHGFGHLAVFPAAIFYGGKSVHFLPSPDAPEDNSPRIPRSPPAQ